MATVSLATPDNTPLTKDTIRSRVWGHIERHDLANFPRPVHNRIPNFKGAARAGARISHLPEFTWTSTVKVNPDKPQEEVRFRVLEGGKDLLVPTPRLRTGLFNRMTTGGGNPSRQHFKMLASRKGIDNHSQPIPLDTKLTIDMVVIGSVAVDRKGHRIGKGEGFADLEFALANECHQNAVSEATVVVTTVHECQVFEELPEKLFTPHDVPVDIILTPSEVIRVEQRLPKPKGIIWSLLTREKLKQVNLLQEIRRKHSRLGRNVTLKDK